MIPPNNAANFLAELDALLATSAMPTEKALQLIGKHFPHYHWIGIYWLQDETLVLGPYVGKPTEHSRIAVGRGVCGTAVAEGRNQIVDDVRQVENYLACSAQTRSEIVVLIRRGDRLVGQIDADSDQVAAFDTTDEALLAAVADRLSRFTSEAG